MTIKVLVNGAFGKMGQATVNAIEQTTDLEIVALTGRHDSLALAILDTQPDVVVDFSNANCVMENAKNIIEEGVHPVIGTSGLTESEVNILTEMCDEQKLGGIIAPNFSIGAVLMMHCAELVAQYMDYAEIIEAHHENKVDAPSGTAIKTANLIAKAKDMQYIKTEKMIYENARGANFNNIPIHSIRMPGKLAHQQIIFGSPGETLTIQHDTLNRDCYMPGVLLSCREVIKHRKLIYGLENLILNKTQSIETEAEEDDEVFYGVN